MNGISFVDVAWGVTGRAARTAAGVARRTGPVVRPVAQVVLRPPLLPERLQPVRWLAGLADDGAGVRFKLARASSTWLDEAVPLLLEEVLRRVALTELVQRYVDIDRLVAGVDLDAVAAGLDVDAVVDRVDLDAVAARLDVERVLDRLDLTGLVLRRVDLDAIVQAVLDRLDLIALAEEVIDGVDLPEIIRESTGSMASDTVRGVRMQGIAADEVVGHAVDRFLRRRGARSTEAPSAEPSPTEPERQAVPSQRGPGR